MRRFLTAGLLLGTLVPAGQAAVFTVKPGTAFYSKPQAKPSRSFFYRCRRSVFTFQQ